MPACKSWAILIAAMVSTFAARAAPNDDCPGTNPHDLETTILSLGDLYQRESFEQLDTALDCLMRRPRPFASGHSGSAVVYHFYRRQMSGPRVTPADIARVGRWGQRQPVSMFAEMAALRLRYAFAWKARGGAYASKVQQDNWKTFHQGLLDTEQALYRASPELRDTPIWHQLLLAVAGDTRTVNTDMDKVFEQGVKRWPTYYDFHEVRLSRLVPRWGGSWETVDRFILHFAGQRPEAERDAVYARLYASVMQGASHPAETRLDWPRMKRGLEFLVAHHADPTHATLAASFACAYRDADYLRVTLARIPGKQVHLADWLPADAAARCRAH